MSIKNHPGTPTEESTEAKRFADANSTTPLVNDTTVPMFDQLVRQEVKTFLGTDQSAYGPEDAGSALLDRINKRLISENTKHELRGGLAHRPLKALPPAVIATCILHRELPHTGLIGKSEETAELVTYEDAGPDEGLYVPADQHIRRLARQYHYTISSKDLNAVVECVRDSVSLLEESEDSDVVALVNGLFDLRSKELRPFSPKVVLTSKASVTFREDATTCPVIDGWNVDTWIRETLANNDPEVEHLIWQVIAALFRPNHPFNKAVLLYATSGSNGKGTFLELLRHLVGPERVATLSISDFGEQFLPEALCSAFAVLSDENEVGDFLRKAGAFKAWVTHDWIRINVKYGPARSVKGRGLCVFCVNELPSSKDKSESLYRRFVAIPFLKRYVGADENTAIKNDYVKRPKVLEYVVHKALMMPWFDTFIEPAVCKELLGQIRVENDPVLQFAEEFLPQFKWDLLPWKFSFRLYSAWMRKEVPSGHPVGIREFTKRMTDYVDKNPSCGWFVPRGADGNQKAMSTQNRIVGDEPLAVEYDLSDWIDLQPVGGSMRKIGIPHNIPINARGLMRAGTSPTDDEDSYSSFDPFQSTNEKEDMNHVESR
jgi:poxvirus D5 protein-like